MRCKEFHDADIILEKCYRNLPEVLATSHAIGCGVYRDPDDGEDIGIVQMFSEERLWRDVGYQVAEGSLKKGHSVTLMRSSKTSPATMTAAFKKDGKPVFRHFDSMEEEAEWVVNDILQNIEGRRTSAFGFSNRASGY